MTVYRRFSIPPLGQQQLLLIITDIPLPVILPGNLILDEVILITIAEICELEVLAEVPIILVIVLISNVIGIDALTLQDGPISSWQ